MRKLNLNQKTDAVEYDKEGKPYVVRYDTVVKNVNGQAVQTQGSPPQRADASYEYFIPDDRCYTLDNLYKVCTNKGNAVTIVKYSDKVSAAADPFFGESSRECNILKFNVVYGIFVLQKDVDAEQYQIAIGGYPDFIKAVIIDYAQLLRGTKKAKFDNNLNNLRAFYVTSSNEIGCIPYKKMKLYTAGEAQVYKMHIPQYRLIGEITDEKRDRGTFLELSGPNILQYNREKLRQ